MLKCAVQTMNEYPKCIDLTGQSWSELVPDVVHINRTLLLRV